MKLERVYILYLLCVLMILTVLGACIAGASRPLTPEELEQAESVYAATDYAIEPVTVEHGEDAAIIWKDPGMEEHVRFLLNKPDGEIMRSEVWDVQVLSIQTAFHTKFDVMITELPSEADVFNRANTLDNSNAFHNIGNQEFTPIQTLKDLKNFDSIQVLSILERGSEKTELDMTGIGVCKNLKFVQIGNRKIENIQSLTELKNLEMLFLQNCAEVEIEPVMECKNLRALSLIGCKIESLEGLDKLQRLNYLNLLESEVRETDTLKNADRIEMFLQ